MSDLEIKPWELKTAYDNGQNLMKLLNPESSDETRQDHIELSYDLQSGNYARQFDAKPEIRERKKTYTAALKAVIQELGEVDSVLDAGVGEGTTLWSLFSQYDVIPSTIHGTDLCWSRLAVCRNWLANQDPAISIEVFSASLSELPYKDNSFDLVYTTHAIEPNRGHEEAILTELYRVAGRFIVLIEPAYEFASDEARARMDEHNYCRGLAAIAKEKGYNLVRYEVFEQGVNPMNPSALFVIEKNADASNCDPGLVCPRYKTPLKMYSDCCFSEESMRAYPVIGGIPFLRSSHGVIASRFVEEFA